MTTGKYDAVSKLWRSKIWI